MILLRLFRGFFATFFYPLNRVGGDEEKERARLNFFFRSPREIFFNRPKIREPSSSFWEKCKRARVSGKWRRRVFSFERRKMRATLRGSRVSHSLSEKKNRWNFRKSAGYTQSVCISRLDRDRADEKKVVISRCKREVCKALL